MAWLDLTWRQLLLRLATAAVVWALAAPLALYFSVTLLLRVLWSPFSGFWRPRPRDQPPEVLQDAALGQHAYVTLDKVNLGKPCAAPVPLRGRRVAVLEISRALARFHHTSAPGPRMRARTLSLPSLCSGLFLILVFPTVIHESGMV